MDLILLVTTTEHAKLTEAGLAVHHSVNVSFLCEVVSMFRYPYV